MHRRTLPIADPCSVFRPSPGNTFCGKCEKHVHDLSAMTERAVARFLTAHAGQRICVAYRTRPDGTIVVRPEPRPLGVLLVALGLAACTGYAPEVQHPDEDCRDDQGYQIQCRDRERGDVLVVPDDHSVPEVREPPRPIPVVEEPMSAGGIDVAPPVDPNAALPGYESDPVTIVYDFDSDEVLVGQMIDMEAEKRVVAPERRSSRETRRAARRERRAAR